MNRDVEAWMRAMGTTFAPGLACRTFLPKRPALVNLIPGGASTNVYSATDLRLYPSRLERLYITTPPIRLTTPKMAAADTEQRSPSPAPAAPIASAPGPRATALQRLYTEAIAHVIKTCSYTHFAACFPTPAKHVNESLHGLYDQFTQQLHDTAHKEFGKIMEERNVVPSLNALDGLVEEARRRRDNAVANAADGKVEPPTP